MTTPKKLTESQFKDELFQELWYHVGELYGYYCNYYERDVEDGYEPSMSFFVTYMLDGLAENF